MNQKERAHHTRARTTEKNTPGPKGRVAERVAYFLEGCGPWLGKGSTAAEVVDMLR